MCKMLLNCKVQLLGSNFLLYTARNMLNNACSKAVYMYVWMVLPAGWDKVRAEGEFESFHSTWLVGKLSVQLRTCVPCLSEGYPYREVSTMCMWGKETVCMFLGTLDASLKYGKKVNKL